MSVQEPGRPEKLRYRVYEVNYFSRSFWIFKITLAGLRFLCQEDLQITNSGAPSGRSRGIPNRGIKDNKEKQIDDSKDIIRTIHDISTSQNE
jgi:hypothetical protein